jgi:hypothetical protein
VSNARAIKQQPVVNGINLEDVKDLIETVKQNAREGLTQWKVTSIWQGRTHIRAQIEPFHIDGKTVKRLHHSYRRADGTRWGQRLPESSRTSDGGSQRLYDGLLRCALRASRHRPGKA